MKCNFEIMSHAGGIHAHVPLWNYFFRSNCEILIFLNKCIIGKELAIWYPGRPVAQRSEGPQVLIWAIRRTVFVF